MANFVYLVGDPRTREAAVVDPAWDVGKILHQAEADGYRIRHVLLTHGHPDHINGAEELLNLTNARLYMHKDETPWIKGWKSTVVPTENGSVIRVGDLEITVLHTPGHTPGSQCFRVGNRLLSGDTLFVDSCGRTDLPGGDPRKMFESLRELAKLEDAVLLYPGHNYAAEPFSTMGDQKKRNPFLQCESAQDFVRMFAPSPAF